MDFGLDGRRPRLTSQMSIQNLAGAIWLWFTDQYSPLYAIRAG